MNIKALNTIKNYLLAQEPSTFNQNILGIKHIKHPNPSGPPTETLEATRCGCAVRSAVLALGIKEYNTSLIEYLSILLKLSTDQYYYVFGVCKDIEDISIQNNWPFFLPQDHLAAANRIDFITNK